MTSPVNLFGEPDQPRSEGSLFAEIVFDRPLDRAFDYAVPEALQGAVGLGRRVLVPFGRGNKPTEGFCVGLSHDQPNRPVKSVLAVLDEESLLAPDLMRLTRWMADYYLCGWGQVLNAIVPAGVKREAGMRSAILVELVEEDFQPKPLPDLTAKQREVFRVLQEAGGAVEFRELKTRAGCEAGPIGQVVAKGLARRKSVRVEKAIAFTQDELAPLPSPPSWELTPDQYTVWASLEPALREGGFKPFLLHGVTGSGKTELYLRAILEVIRQGKEALVLVPEISLTPQTIAAFQGRCGKVAVMHSHLQEAERGAYWRQIAAGQVQTIVGARSAVFAPARRLGLIVVDEEHEASFKQDATPRYQGRDVAVMRARLENIPILLGSATPSLESWHNASRGHYTLLSLPKRVLDLPLPQVSLIDLRHDRHPDKRFHGISPSLERAIKLALDAGGQVILLLNRRGFSTFLHCPGCGHVEQCQQCDLALTYHKERDLAICHYCGYEAPPPVRCPECGQGQVRYQGMGTEKLEAEIEFKFPHIVVRRMDSDTMRRPGSHHQVLDAFRKGEIHLLLGTQMIAKGLDFPNVTLVGVVNADVGLHLADFRAGERTFQLLAQVAGRAGRGPKGGKVLVQTFQPEHPSIALAAAHDYLRFAAGEMAQRRQHNYPPFQRLARLVIRSKDQQAAADYADQLASAFRVGMEALQRQTEQPQELRLLGPAQAQVYRLKNKYRHHFQLQSPSPGYLHQVLRHVVPTVRLPGGVELIIDIDPQDML